MRKTVSAQQPSRSMAKNEARILYHFTSRQALPKIFSIGLKAQPVLDWPEDLVGKIKSVWLTVNPEMPPLFSSYAEYRIEVAISHTDVRLVHMRSWMRERLTRKELASIEADSGREWQSFYLYLGNIAAARIRGAQHYLELARIKEYRAEYWSKCAQHV
jgi:hypothetical protein